MDSTCSSSLADLSIGNSGENRNREEKESRGVVVDDSQEEEDEKEKRRRRKKSCKVNQFINKKYIYYYQNLTVKTVR